MNSDSDKVQWASENLELIKRVLQRTTISFSTLQPAFLCLARIWLAYALMEALILSGTLFAEGDLHAKMLLNACNIVLQWLFCVALSVFVFIWRKKLPTSGVDPLASRLAAMWAVVIIGYILLRVLEMVVFPLCFRVISKRTGLEMSISELQFVLCNQVLYYATTIAFAFLPVLLTAVFFRSRAMGWLGIGALAVGVVWSVIWLFSLNNVSAIGIRSFGSILYHLLQFLPPIALFLFSRILKNQNITYLRRKQS